MSHRSILMLSSNFAFSLPRDRTRRGFRTKILSACPVLEAHLAISLSMPGFQLGTSILSLMLNVQGLILVAMG
jgi:hypothetical protein